MADGTTPTDDTDPGVASAQRQLSVLQSQGDRLRTLHQRCITEGRSGYGAAMTFATGDVDRVRPARELLIFGLVLGLCPLVALIEPGDPSTAVDRAVDMLAVERAIGLDVEQGIHHWVVARPAVAFIADLLYIALHMSALVGVLLWAASRRPEVYLGLRNLFVVSHLVSVAIYLAWPTAPPRLVAPSRDGPDTDGVLHHL